MFLVIILEDLLSVNYDGIFLINLIILLNTANHTLLTQCICVQEVPFHISTWVLALLFEAVIFHLIFFICGGECSDNFSNVPSTCCFRPAFSRCHSCNCGLRDIILYVIYRYIFDLFP